MRIFSLIVALLLAGCGAGERSGGGPPTSTVSPPVESGRSVPFDEAEVAKPPSIVLESAAGRQHAVPESFCVDYVDEASGQGVGLCGDTTDLSPEELSLVRPGEEIRIFLENASVSRPEGCVAEDEQGCIGGVAARQLGCERAIVAEIPLALGSETRWQVDLPPGQYELQVFAYFEAPDGRSGDVSGSLGIFVADDQPQKVIPVPDTFVGC